MKRFIVMVSAAICVAALCVGVVAGCAPASSSLDSAQQGRGAYMSQVNSLMEKLNTDLDSFVDAVSRKDLVNMRTQADNAYKAIDDLAAIEPPEELSDVHQKYKDGTAKLREALDKYITLFAEVNGDSFDQSTYEKRIADIQVIYDEGVDLLKQGDEAAASKQSS